MQRRSFLARLLGSSCYLALPPGVLGLAGCSGAGWAQGVVGFDGPTMGTGYAVRLAAPPRGSNLATLQREVSGVLARLSARMSTYTTDSELSRFNAGRGEDWFVLSPPTRTVLGEAMRIGELCGGAFDVTVGPLVNLWGFGPPGTPAAAPTTVALEAARRCIGPWQLRLEEDAARKARPEVYVDLSGIAKGYAVDAVAAHLERRGIGSYLVEIGGELRARGSRPDGGPWRVGIERPQAPQGGVQCVLALDGAAVATSGDYRNVVTYDGTRYSHTIDPRSGRPVGHALASATVVAGNTMSADALATAIMVLGPDAGLAFAERHGVAAYLLARTRHGLEVRQTPAFQRHVAT